MLGVRVMRRLRILRALKMPTHVAAYQWLLSALINSRRKIANFYPLRFFGDCYGQLGVSSGRVGKWLYQHSDVHCRAGAGCEAARPAYLDWLSALVTSRDVMSTIWIMRS